MLSLDKKNTNRWFYSSNCQKKKNAHDLIEVFTSDDAVVENELVGTFEISDDHSQDEKSSETHLLSSNLTTNSKSESSQNIVSLTMSDDDATSAVQGVSQVSTCNANDQQISVDEKQKTLNNETSSLTRTKSSLEQRSNSTTDSESGKF